MTIEDCKTITNLDARRTALRGMLRCLGPGNEQLYLSSGQYAPLVFSGYVGKGYLRDALEAELKETESRLNSMGVS